MKITYKDLFFHNQVLVNIPTRNEERALKAGTATSLLLMRVAYQSKLEEYETLCRKMLDDIKKGEKYAGFDAMTLAIEEARRVLARKKAYDEWAGKAEERPVCPSEEELAKADEALAKSGEYEKMLDELTREYGAARDKQAEVETTIEVNKLTRAELEDIVGLIGVQDSVRIKTAGGEFDEPAGSFLALVAKLLV